MPMLPISVAPNRCACPRSEWMTGSESRKVLLGLLKQPCRSQTRQRPRVALGPTNCESGRWEYSSVK